MKKTKIAVTDSVSVGRDAPTALNVLIGANDAAGYCTQLEKLDAITASKLPVAIVTDLSLYKPEKGKELWRKISHADTFIAGTVPVYQAVRPDHTISPEALLDLIREQAENGVKIITIHPTPDRRLLELSRTRCIPITSRGGGVVCWDMLASQRKENIYIKILDEILDTARKNQVTLSIGSSFRSAALKDAMDQAYLTELERQIEIASYCRSRGVNVILETPGHASPQHIFEICRELNAKAPFPIMPLGPLPTDCAFEQDDMAACIGAVLMGTHGCADILSVVTAQEHTGGIPTIASTLSALKKYAVAKHIIDIYKLGDTEIDNSVSQKRRQHLSCAAGSDMECSRCGNLCPFRFSYLSEIEI